MWAGHALNTFALFQRGAPVLTDLNNHQQPCQGLGDDDAPLGVAPSMLDKDPTSLEVFIRGPTKDSQVSV